MAVICLLPPAEARKRESESKSTKLRAAWGRLRDEMDENKPAEVVGIADRNDWFNQVDHIVGLKNSFMNYMRDYLKELSPQASGGLVNVSLAGFEDAFDDIRIELQRQADMLTGEAE